MPKPDFTIKQILEWADRYHARTGKWPKMVSGRIVGSLGETWLAVDKALRNRGRGLSIPDMSLARLLEERRRARNMQNLPRLNKGDIIKWAKEHFERTGTWPTRTSGPVVGVRTENWQSIYSALRMGLRGLPGGLSLPRLISAHRKGARRHYRPALEVKQIIRWAAEHLDRFGYLPTAETGSVSGQSGLTWGAVDLALRSGLRGLPGGTSLSRVLRDEFHRRAGRVFRRPDLTVEQILTWADAHHKRTGVWPMTESGAIHGVPGETWRIVDAALKYGLRRLTLPKMTLARLLKARRGVRHRSELPNLSVRQLHLWVRQHYRRFGVLPTAESGPIPGSAGETWHSIDDALHHGRRGLPGGSSLTRHLMQHHGYVPLLHYRVPLTNENILTWARAYRKAHGRLPNLQSGQIEGVPGTSWAMVNNALSHGYRGLPGNSSLRKLFTQHFGTQARRIPSRPRQRTGSL